MARRLVVFGNVAVGPIAIGNVAVGYVAIGLSIAIGPIAIGINSIGFLLAIGLNAIGLIDIAAINGVGAITFAGVNALGALTFGGVNHGGSSAVGVLVGVAEAVGAYVFRRGPAERERPLDDDDRSGRVRVRRATDEGLELARGGFLPWADDIDWGYRRGVKQMVARTPLMDVELRVIETSASEDRYRAAPEVSRRRVLVAARSVPIERWYAAVFHQTLVAGAILAFVVAVVAFLLP